MVLVLKACLETISILRQKTHSFDCLAQNPSNSLIIVFLIISFLSLLQGWYIVTYALGIYQLNLFIAFLTPKIDPALEELGESDIGVFLHLL